MTWIFNGEPFILPTPNPYEGFVYIIENIETGKKYIGKKNFWSRRKNKKTNRKETKESDWKQYYGSCEELHEDLKNTSPDNFKRTILHLCVYKKQMSFLEEFEQWNNNVLIRDDFYNTNIGGKFFVKEKHIYEAKHPTITTKNDVWRKIKSDSMTGENNIAKRPDVRKKLSEKKKGSNHHQFGKPISDEHKNKLHTAAMKVVVKKWKITTPGNEIFIIENLLQYCKDHNLTMSAMCSVAKNKRSHHKQYKCEAIIS